LVLSDHQSIIDHALAGARLLSSSVEPIFKIASAVAMHHHEWWNGCGYPQGLKGELIPLEARICAIADTYDTLTHPEPGIAAWTHKEAVQQICAMAGVQLDPNLISPFLQALEGAGALKERVAIEVDQSMERNQLARAKRKLFETLELVD
ncbi:MAG: HD-GYP domain-containing protein, partial [Burkholderiaceae bacterium]